MHTLFGLFGHAQGTLLDVVVPLPALLLVAAGAVVGTGAALTRRDHRTHTPPLRRDPDVGADTRPVGTVPLPAVARALGVLLLVFLLSLALAGPGGADRNPLPRVLLVLVWGGLVPLSLVFGPVYRSVNPLRPLATGLRRLAGREVVRPLPAALGRWPAAVLAVVVSAASQFGLDALTAVSVGFLLYVAVQAVAGAVWGQEWFTHGDAFEVLGDVLGAVAPFGRRADGRLGIRDPVLAPARASTPPGTVAFAGVLVGATYFEALAEAWTVATLPAGVLGTALSGALAGGLLRLGAVRPFLVPALLPVAGAYALQLYLVPLLLDGRIALSQLTDPFGRGVALPELVARGVQLPLPDAAVAWLLYLVFLGLHALAVVVAHRASLARFDLRGARAVQFPLRAVLLGSVVLGLWVPTLGT